MPPHSRRAHCSRPSLGGGPGTAPGFPPERFWGHFRRGNDLYPHGFSYEERSRGEDRESFPARSRGCCLQTPSGRSRPKQRPSPSPSPSPAGWSRCPPRLGSVRLRSSRPGPPTQRPSQIQGTREGGEGLRPRQNRGVEANTRLGPLQGPILLPLNPAGAVRAINSLLCRPVFQIVLPILKIILISSCSTNTVLPCYGV